MAVNLVPSNSPSTPHTDEDGEPIVGRTSIGASMVEYIHRNSLPFEERNQQIQRSSSSSSVKHRERKSVLLSAVDHQKTANQNILLVNGKGLDEQHHTQSSLVMDMAYSIASSSSCPHHPPQHLGVVHSCKCIAVTILVPSFAVATPSVFPVYCQYIPCLKHSSTARKITTATSSSSSSNSTTIKWDKRTLEKIQIQYCSSSAHLLEYLLGIQGQHSSQQPYGGIIMQEIDSFVQIMDTAFSNTCSSPQPYRPPRTTTNILTNQQWMEMTKLLAVLVDTTTMLRHNQLHQQTINASSNNNNNSSSTNSSNSSSLTMLVTMATTNVGTGQSCLLPKHIERLWTHNYFHCMLSLQQQQQHHEEYRPISSISSNAKKRQRTHTAPTLEKMLPWIRQWGLCTPHQEHLVLLEKDHIVSNGTIVVHQHHQHGVSASTPSPQIQFCVIRILTPTTTTTTTLQHDSNTSAGSSYFEILWTENDTSGNGKSYTVEGDTS